jgi:membrane-bound serine protease (ClpP class)
LIFFIFATAIKNRKRPVVSGREYLIGAPAEALEDFDTEGWARVQGETWRVRATAPVRRGERLRVRSIEGLVLNVEAER